MITNGIVDTYILGLTSASLFNTKMYDAAMELGDEIRKHQDDDGKIVDCVTSITLSEGISLNIETTSIAIIAWMNDYDRYSDNIEKAVQWIIQQVENGRYGSTQATILALKAHNTYLASFNSTITDGELVLLVDNEELASVPLSKNSTNQV